jgi:hypothetical protein
MGTRFIWNPKLLLQKPNAWPANRAKASRSAPGLSGIVFKRRVYWLAGTRRAKGTQYVGRWKELNIAK